MCEVQLLPLQATLRALLDLITKPYGGGNLFYLLSHNMREIQFYEISFRVKSFESSLSLCRARARARASSLSL